jgi:hypothetical protein
MRKQKVDHAALDGSAYTQITEIVRRAHLHPEWSFLREWGVRFDGPEDLTVAVAATRRAGLVTRMSSTETRSNSATLHACAGQPPGCRSVTPFRSWT